MKLTNKTSKTIGYVVGIVIFISMIAGITYAMYRKTLYNVNVAGTASNNLDNYIIYSKGVNISSGTLNPTDDYTNGTSTAITFYQSSSSPYNLYGQIYFDINDISDILLDYDVIKYKIIDNNSSNVVGEGSLCGAYDSVLAAYNIPLSTSETTFTIYLWVDVDYYVGDMAGAAFDIDVRCQATMKEVEYIKPYCPNFNTEGSIASYVTNLYNNAEKSTATVHGITYNLAPSVGLMNDRHASMNTDINGGDIRYYGANPNNYVWLGDTYQTDYNTYTPYLGSVTRKAGDKKLWRIIGVFEGRLKLIQNDSIASISLSWDTSSSDVNDGYGINQWGPSGSYEGADLMRLLNEGYNGINGSLYWNKGIGTVYTSSGNVTTGNVDFANTGLSLTEKKFIDKNAIWYLGAQDKLGKNDTLYIDMQYTAERQNAMLGKICSSGTDCTDSVERTSTWTGAVGLIYPSDAGYSTDLSTCSQSLVGYSYYPGDHTVYTGSCRTNSWLKGLITISPYADNSKSNCAIFFGNGLSNYASSNVSGIKASVYLTPSASFLYGTGTESDPFVLATN